MATHRVYFGQLLGPDTSGSVYWRPASIENTNDLYATDVLAFNDSGTKIGASAVLAVPKNYVGTAKIGIRWRANATAGDVVFDVDYRAVAAGESSDPASHQESLTSTVTTDATALDETETLITLTASNLAADDMLYVTIARDGAQAADTLANELEIIEAFLEYTDA